VSDRASALGRLGLLVHPTREVSRAIAAIEAWASEHGVQVARVTHDRAECAVCDLLVALGGDGTTLAALHAGAAAGRPVLGVACGSVGVLTSVDGTDVSWALEEIAAGRATAADIPGLQVRDAAGERTAINDIAVLRESGQVLVTIDVDGDLYARVAGDGAIVATALGSSAYTMASGGPLLAPGAEGMAITPLAAHGGSIPPLVAGSASTVTLDVVPAHGGSEVRLELDGRPAPIEGSRLTIGRRGAYATLVQLEGEEPRLAGLRRRGLITDSPRAHMHGD
jgi:NAD+ kinase